MFPQGQYKTIYIDPPWPERGGGKIKRGADRHYALMSIKEIKALPIASLADPEGCHLYMWTTNNHLPDALECVKAWGFQYVTLITWCKDSMGLGAVFSRYDGALYLCNHTKKITLQVGGRKAYAGSNRLC